MQDEMIRELRSLKARQAELDEAKERGRAYVEQVREAVAQDLRPLEEAVEAARWNVEVLIRDHNGGQKFRVPGLGTAYLQRRRAFKVVDPEALARSVGEAERQRLYDPPKINTGRAKSFAQSVFNEDGQILPGVETEEVESLSIRFS